jgi:hypothetical protein
LCFIIRCADEIDCFTCWDVKIMEGDLRQPRSGSGGKKYRHVVLKSGLCESIAKLSNSKQ